MRLPSVSLYSSPVPPASRSRVLISLCLLLALFLSRFCCCVSATVEDNIAAWIEGTRKKLLKQKSFCQTPGLPDAIAEEVAFLTTKLVSNADGSDGGTSKLLVETHDGHQVEAVVVRFCGR